VTAWRDCKANVISATGECPCVDQAISQLIIVELFRHALESGGVDSVG